MGITKKILTTASFITMLPFIILAGCIDGITEFVLFYYNEYKEDMSSL